MSVPAAYLGVILIWSTTPITIQWSGQGGGFLFGVAARMSIGVLVSTAVVSWLRGQMPMHRRAWLTYLISGVGLFVAMTAVYWAARWLPSGWISVVFGLSPVVTGAMAALWLGERAFTHGKVIGMALGIGGLLVLASGDLGAGSQVQWGVLGVLVSVLAHSASAVWIKRLDAGVSPLNITVGSLWVALPGFLLNWWWFGEPLPASLPPKTLGAIVYLGVVGSVLGFVLYFHVLRRLEATQVALITLITPVWGLLVGHWFNQEPLPSRVWVATGLILAGLASFQWLSRLVRINPIGDAEQERQ